METLVKNKVVPKLRFAEFDGDWNNSKFSDVFKINAGGDVKKENTSDTKSDMFKYPIYANAKKNKGLYGYSDIYKVEENTITVAGRGVNIGIAHARNHKFYPIVRLLVLRPTIDADIYFLKYQINKTHWYVESTGVPQLTAPQIASYKIKYPKVDEQQKIASFLIAVDDKIQQLTKKKELIKQYKKGLMQQIFNRELRFKDDNENDYPNWEEKSYGGIYSFFTTNSLSRDKLNYDISNIRNIHYGDIHTKFSSRFDVENEYVPFINSDVDLSRIKDECYCQVGDLVIADASEDYEDIGKTIEISNLNNEKVLAGLHTFLARPNKFKMANGFMTYLVQTWGIRKQVMTIAQGTKVLGLATSRLSKVKLDIPSFEEQQKVASLLSGIDDKIEQVAEQLEGTQQFKKGLLQQMFV